MNYFAHGRAFLDHPYFLAGTAVPDWLGVLDRRVRVRQRAAEPWTQDADPRIAALAAGIVRHHQDDAWFHGTRAFAELSLALAVEMRPILPEDEGHRRGFLGHILVEILLDAVLIERQPKLLDGYYAALTSLDAEAVEAGVSQMASAPAARLALLIPRFVAEGFLWDYAHDDRLCYRLNQVLTRVRLPALPAEFAGLLPAARRAVAARADELLESGAP